MVPPKPVVQQLSRDNAPKIGRLLKLRLDKNENLVGLPDAAVRSVFASITPIDLASYPETQGLYAAIANRHAVTPAHVMVSAGSELAIRYVFEAYLEPGSELVLLDPSFAMFEVYGFLQGARIVKIPFDRELNVPVSRVLDGLTRQTRIVAIANPNNPTGTVFSEEDLVQIATRASEVGSLLLVDEAYVHFYGQSLAARVVDLENLIVVRTFSKAFGLAGVRLGYALGSPGVIGVAQKVQPIDHASVFAVRLGEYAIAHEELAWQYAEQVAEGQAYLVRELRAFGLPVIDGHTNSVLVDLGSERSRIVASLADRVLIGGSVRLPFPNDYVKIGTGPLVEMERLVRLLRPVLESGAPGRGFITKANG